METNLKAKAEKYETKAAQCEEWAREAMEGPERSLYGELADYYGKLATDFRQSSQGGASPSGFGSLAADPWDIPGLSPARAIGYSRA